MIEEAYCSYEVAKLLKEKGFDIPCQAYYCKFENGDLVHTTYAPLENHNSSAKFISMPTHQLTMAWLREVHKILITIIPQKIAVGVNKLCYGIYRITEDGYTPLFNGSIKALKDSYENIEETILKYVLNYLV